MGRTNALNINRLSKYNFKFISLEEVLVLEYLIAYYQKNQLDIVVPNRIELELGLKRTKITKATEMLEEKGYVTAKIENLRTKYSLDFDKIVKDLNKLVVNKNKYAMQFFLFVQNPNGFKTKAAKAKKGKIVQKSKEKTATTASQMSLF